MALVVKWRYSWFYVFFVIFIGINGSVADSGSNTPNEFNRVSNKTLKEHNDTNSLKDYHQYYNSSFINDKTVGHHYWVDMSRPGVIIDDMLSQSHQRAATVKLSFDFPFYGQIVRNVTVATGGFLNTGEYVHTWLSATQYIAPLMANFDTRISNDSFVKYIDNGTSFTVQWEKVVLQDKPNSGEFTFQATLHQNGDIVFVYQNVPVVIKNIEDDNHPVKVGVSDAYIIERSIFFVRRKIIYEYHRVNFEREEIKNWTVIVLNALPTCLDNKDCESCLTSSSGFQCKWCPEASRCSTGTDRNRQDWLNRGCDKNALVMKSQCRVVVNMIPDYFPDGETKSAAQTDHSSEQNITNGGSDDDNLWKEIAYEQNYKLDQETNDHDDDDVHDDDGDVDDGEEKVIAWHSTAVSEDKNETMGYSGTIGILFIVTLVGILGMWALFVYGNPYTAIKEFLNRYRPSPTNWEKEEAHYTPATIHM